MSTIAADHPTPAHPVLVELYRHLIRTLQPVLPPPPTDDPADRHRRDHAAIAQIAALAPGNAVEAELAAQYVAASAHWKYCLRLAGEPGITRELAMKCGTQALAMMRQADRARRQLRELQAERRKLQADPAACQRAARTEQLLMQLMAAALADLPAAPPAAPEPRETPAPVAEPAPAPPAAAAPARQRAERDPALIAAAERYAATYPERAAFIRRTGQLPPGDVPDFKPLEGTLLPALVAGRTPALLALDQPAPKAGHAT